MSTSFTRRRSEPILTLINVVFLLLAFFLVAGTLAARPPADLQLVALPEGARAPEPGRVALSAQGEILWPEGVADASAFIAQLPPEAGGVARILPDRAAPAPALVALARDLSAAGAQGIRLVAERGDAP
ncbi:biopolymer transporter ExbD [Thioclava sp. JE_KL1]|uniref:ExbD/TolR family protein n=1 Tax=Thioclava sp. JE_KL1 TaxID=2651187 RepID=UPI00128DEE54|nr:biopolymer transporter ExbD [Thioclava sp. JE_KL1]MPQ94889.1 biopolymer transporter ExbD [Thioclava sp. JE_KL1]